MGRKSGAPLTEAIQLAVTRHATDGLNDMLNVFLPFLELENTLARVASCARSTLFALFIHTFLHISEKTWVLPRKIPLL